MFRTSRNKGFVMEFDNGFGISVQWGIMNYCSAKNLDEVFNDLEMKGNSKEFRNAWESNTAEIAVFKGEKMMSVGDNGQVIGWLTTDDVAQVIEIVSKYKTEITIMKKIIKLNL